MMDVAIDFNWQVVIGAVCAFVSIFGLSLVILYYIEYTKSTGRKTVSLKYLVALLIFLIILPLVLSVLAFFAVASQLISVLLRIKYKSKFAGLLDGTDAIHTVEGKSKNVGNILFIVRFDESEQHFYNSVREAILARFAKSSVKTPKVWFALRRFLGYSFYLKQGVTTEDCVNQLAKLNKQEISKDECVNLVSSYSNQSLPKDHTALWEVLIGTEPVKWSSKALNTSTKQYPVLLRIHHCMSDAASFVKVFVRIFGDVKTEIKRNTQLPLRSSTKVNERITIKLPTTKEVKITSKPITFLWNSLRLTLRSIYVLIMVPPILLVQSLVKAKDENALHGIRLSGKKHFAGDSEERPHYVQVIKKVKSKVGDTAFPDVLFAAISASFAEFFEKYSKNAPKSIAGLVPLFPPPSQLPHFIPEKPTTKKVVCRNIFSLGILKLPLSISNDGDSQNNDALRRLALVKKQIKIFKTAIDYQVNYIVLMLFIGILPQSLRKLFAKMLHCTFIISIVPAPAAMTVLDGYAVDDVMFWVPNIASMGIGFSVFSYDKRLQIGLIADKALLPEQKDAQDIVDGIYRYLDMLNIETDSSKV